MKKFFTPLTPILIILSILLIITLFLSFYFLFINNNGGMALGGLIAFLNAGLIFGVLVIERFMIKRINSSKIKIWVVEFLIIMLVILFFYNYGKIPFAG